MEVRLDPAPTLWPRSCNHSHKHSNKNHRHCWLPYCQLAKVISQLEQERKGYLGFVSQLPCAPACIGSPPDQTESPQPAPTPAAVHLHRLHQDNHSLPASSDDILPPNTNCSIHTNHIKSSTLCLLVGLTHWQKLETGETTGSDSLNRCLQGYVKSKRMGSLVMPGCSDNVKKLGAKAKQ